MIVQFDQLNIETMIVISPIRLGVGGRAILARFIRSHHVLIKGREI